MKKIGCYRDFSNNFTKRTTLNGCQVKIDHVNKEFGDFVALNDINFTINPGEFFTLLGPSGCGKTTLLRIIAGFEFPDDGAVLFDDKKVSNLPPNKRQSNTVFQSYALFPHLSVYENIAFPLRLKLKKETKNPIKRFANMSTLSSLTSTSTKSRASFRADSGSVSQSRAL